MDRKRNVMDSRIQAYWNKRSHDFNKIRKLEWISPNRMAWYRLLTDILKQHSITAQKPVHILDIGTGTGFFSLLLGYEHKTIGIDSSINMIKLAKENAKAIDSPAQFLLGDATNPPFPPHSFDVIVSRNVTWTLPDVPLAYTNWLKLLKHTGILINVDADYGPIDYSKENTRHTIHSTIDDQLLNECTAIKNELEISYHPRPTWDLEILHGLGATTTLIDNVRPLVEIDTTLHYEATPLFLVTACPALTR